jgi:hypothetical protein
MTPTLTGLRDHRIFAMRRYDCLRVIAPLVADSLVITNLANTATE